MATNLLICVLVFALATLTQGCDKTTNIKNAPTCEAGSTCNFSRHLHDEDPGAAVCGALRGDECIIMVKFCNKAREAFHHNSDLELEHYKARVPQKVKASTKHLHHHFGSNKDLHDKIENCTIHQSIDTVEAFDDCFMDICHKNWLELIDDDTFTNSLETGIFGKEFECTDDGFYPDIHSCHQYYACRGGVRTTEHCPNGGVFDQQHTSKEARCVSSKHAACDGPKHCGDRILVGLDESLDGTKDHSQYGEFPWMVALTTQGTNEYVAVGSLVHPRFVLTAAHKVHDRASGLVAHIGDWDIAGQTDKELHIAQTIHVEEIHIHPEFSRTNLHNNLALLVLNSSAHQGKTVMPICLPDSDQAFDGANCIVTGWGIRDLDNAESTKILKKVNVQAVNHNECQAMLRNTRLGKYFELDYSFNCAGGDGVDSCVGDGGSPLICPKSNDPDEYVQIGVASWGIGCGSKGIPSAYGSVSGAAEWIRDVIGQA